MATKQQPRTSPPKAAEVEKSTASGVLRGTEPPSDLSVFPLEQCVLEIRYPQALSLWDSAGALWRAAQEKWPDLRLATAEPAKTSFQVGKTAFVVELKAARIISMDSDKSMDELSPLARDFFRIVASYLRVSLYERLGLRLIYFKEYKDRAEAASAFRSLGLIKAFIYVAHMYNPSCRDRAICWYQQRSPRCNSQIR